MDYRCTDIQGLPSDVTFDPNVDVGVDLALRATVLSTDDYDNLA